MTKPPVSNPVSLQALLLSVGIEVAATEIEVTKTFLQSLRNGDDVESKVGEFFANQESRVRTQEEDICKSFGVFPE